MDNKEETPQTQCKQCQGPSTAKYLRKHKVCSKCKKAKTISSMVTRSQTIEELRDKLAIIEEINNIIHTQFKCTEKTHIEMMFAISLEIDELLIKRINATMSKSQT